MDLNGHSTGGLLADLVETALNISGIKYKIVALPAKRLYLEIADGNVDVWIGTLGVPEYEGRVFVSPKPISSITMNLYSLQDVKSIPRFISDLHNTSLITIRGYSYTGALKVLSDDPRRKVVIQPTGSHESAFQMLVSSQAQYVLDYKEPADVALKKLGFTNVNSVTVSNVPLYIFISKRTPDAQRLMDIFVNAVKQIH